MNELERKRECCSKYIREHFGIQMDNTPWWDKWRIYGFYEAILANEGVQSYATAWEKTVNYESESRRNRAFNSE